MLELYDMNIKFQRKKHRRIMRMYFVAIILSHSRYKYIEWLDPFTAKDFKSNPIVEYFNTLGISPMKSFMIKITFFVEKSCLTLIQELHLLFLTSHQNKDLHFLYLIFTFSLQTLRHISSMMYL